MCKRIDPPAIFIKESPQLWCANTTLNVGSKYSLTDSPDERIIFIETWTKIVSCIYWLDIVNQSFRIEYTFDALLWRQFTVILPVYRSSTTASFKTFPYKFPLHIPSQTTSDKLNYIAPTSVKDITKNLEKINMALLFRNR